MKNNLAEYVQINPRFSRSININHDYGDAELLAGFVCPTSSELAILNISDNISKTGQSAFTWTGPYGAGKSSLLLFLASLLGKDKHLRGIARSHLSSSTLSQLDYQIQVKKGWDCLRITGDLQDVSTVLHAAIEEKQNAICDDIFEALTNLSHQGDGLLIFIDEMGKCLEAMAQGQGDIYFLQKLAEFVSRSSGRIILIGTLHQAFSEYAKILPHRLRDEWNKIQGRYIDIPINTASEEQVELVRQAIKSKHQALGIISIAQNTVDIISNNKALVSKDELKGALVDCWPISPPALIVLTQLSKRGYGQNQRSIFSFLSSGETLALRHFLKSHAYGDDNMYMPEDMFDYIRNNFETAITSSSDSKKWNLVLDLLQRLEAKEGSLYHVNVLKTICLLDIFAGGSGLRCQQNLLETLYPSADISAVLRDLIDWAFIVYRKYQQSYAIFEGSDFELDKNIREGYLATQGDVLGRLTSFVHFNPVIAKRHYHEYGCIRWFNLHMCSIEQYKTLISKAQVDGSAVGHFCVLLPSSPDEKEVADEMVKQECDSNSPVIATVGHGIELLLEQIREVLALEWIETNKNELAGDRIARREIEQRKNILTGQIGQRFQHLLSNSEWFYKGESLGALRLEQISSYCSDICDSLFSHSPKIKSELLNKSKPSGSANSALYQLLRDMLTKEGKPQLDYDSFTPSRGLYEILLADTQLYQAKPNGIWGYVKPKTHNLDKIWQATIDILQESRRPLNLAAIYEHWEKCPYGVKAGLHSFLALAFILSNKETIAVYRDDVYIPTVDDLLLDYLLKSPKTVSIMLITSDDEAGHNLPSITQVLNEIDTCVQIPLNSKHLDVARKLVTIVDKLHPWVKKTKTLSKRTTKFREILKSAADPFKLLHNDLEAIFFDDSHPAEDRNAVIAQGLRESLEEMVGVYPELMRSISLLMTDELDVPLATSEKLATLRQRAKNIKQTSGNFRIEAFASRISTFNAGYEDIAGIMSLACNKPPADWIDLDIENAKKEILRLCTEFKKAELYTKVQNRPSSRQAIAFISGIGGQAEVTHHEFDYLTEQESQIQKIIEDIEPLITPSINKNIALAALAKLSIQLLDSDDE